jgi:hypothetical protein
MITAFLKENHGGSSFKGKNLLAAPLHKRPFYVANVEERRTNNNDVGLPFNFLEKVSSVSHEIPRKLPHFRLTEYGQMAKHFLPRKR